MRVALYIRVSTEEQVKEGFSISAQRERLISYAHSQDWDIIGFYVDEGVSAKDTNRPELQRMLADIKNNLVDVVLVYRLDRLTRSVLDLYKILAIFEKNNCKFKSATEVYDTTTAIGRLFITLVAALAQWERENLGERVRMGMTEKVKQGEWKGSVTPYGVDYINKKLVINEEEASIMKLIYKWYIYEGTSDRKIAIRLNKLGYRGKTGKLWAEATVRGVLTNPIAIGELRWNYRLNKDQYFTVPNSAPVIIEPTEYLKAQQIRKSRSKFHGRQSTGDYIFSGILRCSRCGSTFKGHVKNDKKYNKRYKSYKCRNSLIHECDMPLLSEIVVQRKFIDYFKKIDFNKEAIEYSNEGTKEDQNEKERAVLIQSIEKIKERRKKWQYAWANDMLNDDEFKTRMAEEQEKENDLRDQLSEYESDQIEITLTEDMYELFANSIAHWDQLDDTEKKQLMQFSINSILVDSKDAKKPLDKLLIKEISFN